VCGCDIEDALYDACSHIITKSSGVGSMPRWALAMVIMVRYRTNIFHDVCELFIMGALNIIERADLVFQDLIEIKRVPPSLNTEECNT
jgi:hypothetical protein